MKNLNQVRGLALREIAEINERMAETGGFAPDSVHTAYLLDICEYHETVLAMCDRLDASPVAVAIASRNFAED